MCGCRTSSKCLMWLMAVLSSLQALQGTPAACQLGVCVWANEAVAASCCRDKGSDSSKRAKPSSAIPDHASLDYEKPSPPCDCPANCWCRGTAQAVAPSSDTSDATFENEMIVTWEVVAAPPISHCTAMSQLSHPTSNSALQVCAVLCRFLA